MKNINNNEEYNDKVKKRIKTKVKSIINKFKKFQLMDQIQSTRSHLKFPIYTQSRPITSTINTQTIKKTYQISGMPSISPKSNRESKLLNNFKINKPKHIKGAISVQIPKKLRNLNEETVLSLVHEKKETGFYIHQYNELRNNKPKSARVYHPNKEDDTVIRVNSPVINSRREQFKSDINKNSQSSKGKCEGKQISSVSNSNHQALVKMPSLSSSNKNEKVTRNTSMRNVILSKFNQGKSDEELTSKNFSRQNSKVPEKRHSHLNDLKVQLIEQSERMKNLLGDLKRRQSMNEDLLKRYTINLKIEQIKKRKASQLEEI